MCRGSDTQAEVYGDQVQTFDGVPTYHARALPGGARHNHASYGVHLDLPEAFARLALRSSNVGRPPRGRGA